MVPLASEPLFYLRGIPFTNTSLNLLLIDAIIVGGVVAINRKIKLVPNSLQNITEMMIETFYNLVESVAEKKTAKIFPYFMSFFLIILLINLSGLLPGVSSIGFFHGSGHEKELVPLLRSATSDINTTFALALISVVATHVMSIQTLGIKEYLGRYFSLNPINLFVGFLEIISEITKVLSLSFRLFGNIYAGEVVLATVSSIFAFIFPLPFLMLEFIVGFVQALVFSMLTMAFMAILTTSHHEA
ncbi:MAG: F0F1 ATP synthase subunit A [Patescibacteria group bacterium]|nr:F0F1 ATP synthase subunit A [Patescibacteria group bacterium]